MQSSPDSWIVVTQPNPSAYLRLFCFPHAGGGAATYRLWSADLAPEIEVCRVQFPGRENRLREPPFTQFSSLLEAVVDVLRPQVGVPFAFFGHSMGALVAFELARELRERYGRCPVHLFVSGSRAPQSQMIPPDCNMPDAQFLETLCRRYGANAVPDAVVHDPELRDIFLPILRADMSVLESYMFAPGDPLDCPITALSGEQDPLVSYEHIAGWDEHTSGLFELKLFPGGHFFLKDAHTSVLKVLSDGLMSHLRQAQ